MTTDTTTDYLDNPENATKVRLFRVADGEWHIDAVDDDGNYTEVCWDHYYGPETDGEWVRIPTLKVALRVARMFAEENVPHLVGTKPKVSPGDLRYAASEGDDRCAHGVDVRESDDALSDTVLSTSIASGLAERRVVGGGSAS